MQEHNGIHITKKQASITTALLILLGLLIFIGGYFLGKQSMIASFTQKTSQESFNDQVDYMLTMQSFVAKHGSLPENDATDDTTKEQNVATMLKDLPDALEEDSAVEAKAEVKANMATAKVAAEPKTVSKAVQAQHFAALAGFAKKSVAMGMQQRLKKHGIDVDVKMKTSKSASGKSVKTWYQVVTQKYHDNEQLQSVVDRIVSIEHIKRKDVKIF